ncbi:MAG: 6-bladed beta-propeller, partial [Bacteroidales bacterium]|nr:6-bladed beta-propeller [Bacteroidales bacterium]
FKAWLISVYDNYIGIRQQRNPYKLFDKSGKFLTDVGARGQGPGEYSFSPYDDVIDEKNKKIYLGPFARSPHILTYDLDGNYLGNITLPFDMNKPKLHLNSNGNLSFIQMVFPNDDVMGAQLDKSGEIIQQVAPIENISVQSFDSEIFATRNTDAFDFQHTSIDSLFHYDLKDNVIRPVFTTLIPGEKSFKQYVETKDYFITLAWGKKAVIATHKKDKTSARIKLVNDFYGNMEFPINVLSVRNGYYVLSLEPGELITKIEDRLQESSCTEADKKVLNDLLSTLDDNSNNVLFYGKLKK